MGLLDQFFRLREPAWSGRVVMLGALAARCPVPVERANPAVVPEERVVSAPPPLAESVPGPPPAAETQPSAEASPAEPAPPAPPPRRLRKTGDASVIAPHVRTMQAAPAPVEDHPAPPAVATESAAAAVVESREDLAEVEASPATEAAVELPEVAAPVNTDQVDEGGARKFTAPEPEMLSAPPSNGTADLESSPSRPEEISPSDSPSVAVASETPRSSRRSGPCLDDPTLPPLQLRAQVESQVAEIRPLILGQPLAEMTVPEPMELRQIVPPPVRSAPVHALALDANGVEAEAAAEEPTAASESAAPVPTVWQLEIIAGPDFDAPGLLAQIQALPGVIETGWHAPIPDDATH